MTSLDPGQSLVQCDGRHGLMVIDQRPICTQLQNKVDDVDVDVSQTAMKILILLRNKLFSS